MPDDVNLGGTFSMARPGGIYNRLMNRGGKSATGSVSAKLNFDIPGLRDFKTQLDSINKSLDTLNTTFVKLAKGPEAFSRQLETVLKQMKALQAQQISGNRFVTTGSPPSRDPVGQATTAAQNAGAKSIGASDSGGGGGGASSMGQFVTKAIDAMMKRFDANMGQAIAADTYVSRMTTYAGGNSPRTPAGIFRQEGKKGFGFMATDMVQGNQVLYQGTGIGAYYGASGVAGQRGQAYAQSIKQMQEVMPGLDATQGASMQSAIYNNIQGIKLGSAMLGVSPYKQGSGERKTQQAYFREILVALQRQPRANGKSGSWSKEELMQMNFPGSRLNAWLSTILPEEAIPGWFEWAITNAAVSDAGKGQLSDDPKVAKTQREAVFGRSLATNAQEATNREAQKEAAFTGDQYGTMNARLDYEKQMLGVLQSIDHTLRGAYGVTGRVPSLLQGTFSKLLGGGVDALMGLFGGDPGYANMGDPEGGTSHLTPDLRKRVDSMMSANPNLRISSAYRDNKRQGDLQGKGPFAPPGKSKHGRGQAVDFANGHGWIAKNARKFGLEAASRYGEPWHVQLAGTLNMGDPIDPGAAARQSEEAQTSAVVAATQAAWVKAQVASNSAAAGGSSTTPSGGTASASDFTPGKDGTLSADQMVTLLHNAGFSGEALVKMVAISKRESSWNPGSYNPDTSTGDNSLGLFQINVLGNLAKARLPLIQKAGGSTINDLYNPEISAKVAYEMWSASGFQPWGPYKGVSELHDVKDEWLNEARAAAEAHGYMGDVGYASPVGGSSGSTTVNGGTSVVFNNTFQLSFPSGASRSSIDVAVKQIASRLEPQMQRMVSRST